MSKTTLQDIADGLTRAAADARVHEAFKTVLNALGKPDISEDDRARVLRAAATFFSVDLRKARPTR